MRKFWIVLVLLILSCGLFPSCKKDPSISCNLEEIKIYQNQEFLFKSNYVEIENYDDGYTLSSKDEKIAKIVKNKIVPVSVGETKLIISLDGYSEVSTEINLIVTEGFIAEWITIDSSAIKINKEIDPNANNKVYFNSNCTEIPIVTYDKNLIDYNYKTGVINAKGVGTTTVNIKFMECEISFLVEVTNVIYTEAMNVSNSTIFKSTTGKIKFSVFPSGANTYRFWTNSKILTIDNEGKYQTFESGVATVYYQYYTAYNQLSSVESVTITVVDSAIEYELEIRNADLQTTTNFMMGKDYKLVIICDESVNSSLFTISNNLNIKSTIAWVENVGYVVDFQFKNEGDNKIDVYYTPSSDLSLQLVRSKTIPVYSDNDIKLVAVWDAYIQNKVNDKYMIFIDNQSFIADYLQFKLYLGDEIYNKDFDLYIVNDDDSLTLIDKTFMPTTSGVYEIVAKIGEEIIDSAIVEATFE